MEIRSLTGLPYPMSWHHIPLNIYLTVCLITCLIFDSRYKRISDEINEILHFRPITSKDHIATRPKDVKLLIGSREEVDFPISIIPDHVVPCGPIIRPAPAIADTDPDTASWLSKRPTVFINLGSLLSYFESDALEMATGLRILFDKASAAGSNGQGLQVLWKLNKAGEYSTETGSALYSILGHEMEQDRVRITQWVKPEPIAILSSGNIICSVHHGGANSFNEAVWYVSTWSCGVENLLCRVPSLFVDNYIAPVYHRLSCPYGQTHGTSLIVWSGLALGDGVAGRQAQSVKLLS